MRVVDLARWRTWRAEYGLALLVDATFASPINFRPLEHGADVVITSATKYLNGHSDVIAGAVAGSASFVEEVTRLMRLWGQAIDPHAAWLVDRGMRTLARPDGAAQRQRRSRWPDGLEAMPRSPRCTIPGWPIHPDHALAEKVLDGFGGMVGLELAGGDQGGASGCSSGSSWSPMRRAWPASRAWSREPRLTSHKGISAERPRGARAFRRVPPAELRHRGRRGHHRGPGSRRSARAERRY